MIPDSRYFFFPSSCMTCFACPLWRKPGTPSPRHTLGETDRPPQWRRLACPVIIREWAHFRLSPWASSERAARERAKNLKQAPWASRSFYWRRLGVFPPPSARHSLSVISGPCIELEMVRERRECNFLLMVNGLSQPASPGGQPATKPHAAADYPTDRDRGLLAPPPPVGYGWRSFQGTSQSCRHRRMRWPVTLCMSLLCLVADLHSTVIESKERGKAWACMYSHIGMTEEDTCRRRGLSPFSPGVPLCMYVALPKSM
jgi:hypothetical protein